MVFSYSKLAGVLVRHIDSQLGLFTCADTLIGNSFRPGVSGGERKRTSIAVELITNPRLLFLGSCPRSLDLAGRTSPTIQCICNLVVGLILSNYVDEPTSGLDSNTAFNIIETLQSLARSGRAVLCTIHQPQAKTYALFDKLVSLTVGPLHLFPNAAQFCP